MKESLQRWLAAMVLTSGALAAHSQTAAPLAPETSLVTAKNAPAATEESFTIATAQDLIVTFTDQQVPAALASASVVVTQGAGLVGSVALAPPATQATLNLSGAVGKYTLRVIGVPSSSFNVGTFTVCVAPKSTPTACITDASVAGNIIEQTSPASPTQSTYTATLTVQAGGQYTITYADEQFPVALASPPNLALFQGTTPVAVPVPASPTTLTLAPGTYSLFAVAQADSTAVAGLYGVSITGPATLLNTAVPVGTLAPATSYNSSTSQSVTLKVTDFSFPAALGSVRALMTNGAASLGVATAAAAATFTAPVGALQLWTYATAGSSAGTYEVDLNVGSQTLLQTAAGVNGGGVLAYAYVAPDPLTAGGYTATANDFQFPAALQTLQYAVAQNDAIVNKATTVGSFAFNATAAPAVLLVAATPPSGGSGMFDINLQTSGPSPQIVFDQTQGASATAGTFASQTVNFSAAGNFDVSLTDLKFPVQFSNLALLVSKNGAVLGKTYGGGTFTINASQGNYQLNLIGTPGTTTGGAQVDYGLYGLEIDNSAPTVTLAASPTTVASGANTTLTWTSTNATACTGSGTGFTGSQTPGSGSATVAVAATTAFSLTCTGAGGSATSQSVTVTVQATVSSSGGGGEIDAVLLLLMALVGCARMRSSFHGRN